MERYETGRLLPSGERRRRALERARREVAAAVMLVADGRSPEVVVANLDYATRAARELRPSAAAAGVVLVPLARAVGRGKDIAARRP